MTLEKIKSMIREFADKEEHIIDIKMQEGEEGRLHYFFITDCNFDFDLSDRIGDLHIRIFETYKDSPSVYIMQLPNQGSDEDNETVMGHIIFDD